MGGSNWLAHAVTDPVQPAFPDRTSATSVAKVGEKIGYPHLLDARSWTPARTSAWDFPAGAQRLRVWTDGDADDEILTAIGIGRYPTEKAPALIRRRRNAREARFATVYDLSGEGKLVTGIERTEKAGIDITVRSTAGDWRIRVGEKNGDVQVDQMGR